MSDATIATIHPALNGSLGGGFTASGVVEIYGEEGVGKTATAISLSTYVPMAFLDLDGTFPHQMVELVGRTDHLVLAQLSPQATLTDLVDMIEPLIAEIDVVAIDPLAILGPSIEESLVPVLSRLACQHESLVLLVNHANAFNESPSQRMTSFYCKQRVQMLKVDANEEQMKVDFRVTKNLIHPPFSYGTLTIPFS